MKKMNNTLMTMAIAGVFIVGLPTASAALIQPGMIDNFDDGTTMGWTNGRRVAIEQGAEVHVPKAKNGYLEIESFGVRLDDEGKEINDNKRLVFFNEYYKYGRGKNAVEYNSPWEGDYSEIKSITADVMATSDTESNLFFRLTFLSNFDGNYYSSKDAFVLSTDGQWNKYGINLTSADFVSSSEYNKPETFAAVDDATFNDAISDVFGLKFLSSLGPRYGGGDSASDGTVIAAKLGIDNITASGQTFQPASNVPLPGAVWLMISGLLGLSGMSSYKRRSA